MALMTWLDWAMLAEVVLFATYVTFVAATITLHVTFLFLRSFASDRTTKRNSDRSKEVEERDRQ